MREEQLAHDLVCAGKIEASDAGEVDHRHVLPVQVGDILLDARTHGLTGVTCHEIAVSQRVRPVQNALEVDVQHPLHRSATPEMPADDLMSLPCRG